ncbi:MAG TPA: glycosyltransferase family 9 protein [candidate division Zixibacteria bacterium]|nr:glycosyltransferase family 9 protein [candidate division Zixibacteria bacterium]
MKRRRDAAREGAGAVTPARDRSLVLFPGALGDFLCFLPALEWLAGRSAVDLLLARSDLAALAPPEVHTGSLERYEVRRLFAPGAAEEPAVRRFFEEYAAVYSWLGFHAPGFAAELARAARGTGVFPPEPACGRTHQIDHYLACCGAPPDPRARPRIRLSAAAIEWSDSFLERHGCRGLPLLALAPGSGAAEKNWPAEFFRAVGRWWRRRTGGRALVVFGPAEEERGLARELDGAMLPVRGLDLKQLAALLSRCDLYVGNDSGVTHLAAAAGVETVALFGPSSPGRWAPRGVRVTIVSRGVDCSPCSRAAMKSCAQRECLTALQPGEVIEKLEKLLEMATLTRGGWRIRVESEAPRSLEREPREERRRTV